MTSAHGSRTLRCARCRGIEVDHRRPGGHSVGGIRRFAAIALAVTLAGCAEPNTDVRGPYDNPPGAVITVDSAPNSGSGYAPLQRPLDERRRAGEIVQQAESYEFDSLDMEGLLDKTPIVVTGVVTGIAGPFWNSADGQLWEPEVEAESLLENDYTVPQLYTEWTIQVTQVVRNLLPDRLPTGIGERIEVIVLEDPSDPTVEARSLDSIPSAEVVTFLDYGAWFFRDGPLDAYFPVNNHQGFVFTSDDEIITTTLGTALPTQSSSGLVELVRNHTTPPFQYHPLMTFDADTYSQILNHKHDLAQQDLSPEESLAALQAFTRSLISQNPTTTLPPETP